MVLTGDNDSQKIIVALHNADRIEKYECKIEYPGGASHPERYAARCAPLKAACSIYLKV